MCIYARALSVCMWVCVLKHHTYLTFLVMTICLMELCILNNAVSTTNATAPVRIRILERLIDCNNSVGVLTRRFEDN